MPNHSLTELSLGDWVHVKIKWSGITHRKPGVSVMAGIIVEEDDRVMGCQQFKLDNGMWFCPQADEVLEHKAKDQTEYVVNNALPNTHPV